MARLWIGILAVVALSCEVLADETLAVSTESVVEFGSQGGDSFTLERVSHNGVVALLNPHGEDCTLRFPINTGESMLVSAGMTDGQQLVCTVSLDSIVDSSTAIFSYRCSSQSPSKERKCPPPE